MAKLVLSRENPIIGHKAMKVVLTKKVLLGDVELETDNQKIDFQDTEHQVHVIHGVGIYDAQVNADKLEVRKLTEEVRTAHTHIHQDKASVETSEANALLYAQAADEAATDSETSAGTSHHYSQEALASKNAAKTSETNAKSSETKSKTSEINAKASETAAATSASKALTSERNAKTSETKAKASETTASSKATIATTQAGIATDKANIATTKASEAATSASKALTSERNAKASENASKASENAAAGSEDIAIEKAGIATTQAGIATTKASESLASANKAKTSETNAKTSETNASNSKNAAANSATDSANSAAASLESEENAKASETSALASKNAAKTSETNANASKNAAATSASTATTKANEALTSANKAKTSETNAKASETAAKASEIKAAEYAATLAGGLLDGGNVDLSSGRYPATPSHGTFWKVTKGGTVSGIDYGVGDTLVYSKASGFYKIDNTESVTSVNGKKGVVVISRDDLSVPSWSEVGLVKSNGFKATGATSSGAIDIDVNTISNGAGVYHKMIQESGSANSARCGTGYHYLQQFKYGSTTNVTQIAIPYGTSATNAGKIGFRTCYSSEWDAWQYVYSTNNKPTPNELGVYGKAETYSKAQSDSTFVNASGDTMTGTLNFASNAPIRFQSPNGRDVTITTATTGDVTITAGDSDNAGTNGAVYLRSNAEDPNQGIAIYKGGRTLISIPESRSAQGTKSESLTRRDFVVSLADNRYTKAESDSRYVNVTGDTMTGSLVLNGTNSDNVLKMYASDNPTQEAAYTSFHNKDGSERWGYDGFTAHESGLWRRVNTKPNGKFSFATSNSGDYQSLLINDKKVYNEGFKPTWSDVGGNNWLLLNGSFMTPSGSRWFQAATDSTGFLPRTNKESYLGNSGWWFKEAWSDSFRGGSVNVTGDVSASELKVTGDVWVTGTNVLSSSSGNVRVGNVEADVGWTVINGNAVYTDNGTGKKRIYDEGHKPTPAEIYALPVAPTYRPSSSKTLDLNTALTSGYAKNYGGHSYWTNKPDGLGYGIVDVVFNENLGYQMAFDSAHADSTRSTGKLWYRTSRTQSGSQQWGTWAQVYTTADKPTLDDINPLKTFTKTLTVNNNWIDTDIEGNDIPSGSYMVQISVNDSATGFYSEIFTGTMSWYSGGTNSSIGNEIFLHNAGHSDGGKSLHLRTLRQTGSKNLKLQISASTSLPSSSYTFKFRRLI